MAGRTPTPAVTETTQIQLHPLAVRREGDEAIVGLVGTGCFVALPADCLYVLDLLGKRLSVGQVAIQANSKLGEDLDIAGFVEDLIDLGFVAEVDGRPFAGPAEQQVSLPQLKAGHVRWALSRWTAAAASLVVCWGLGILMVDPAAIPGRADLIWCSSGGLVLAVNAAIGWTCRLVHELAHLVTARAADVPGKIGLGTRLQFLVAQTDVSGIWARPRRVRVVVYLSGTVVDLVVGAGALLTRQAIGPESTPGRILGATALLAIAPVPVQLLLFMRTDAYFLLQDLAGCRNLYLDGSRYVAYLGRTVTARLRRRHVPTPGDPTADLAPRERRAVRAYAPCLAIGTAACLGFAITVTLPATLTLLSQSVQAIAGNLSSPLALIDSTVTLVVLMIVPVLWIRVRVRQHPARRMESTSGRDSGANRCAEA